MNDKKAKQLRKLAKMEVFNTDVEYMQMARRKITPMGYVEMKQILLHPRCYKGVYRALKKHAKGVSNGKM